MSRDKLPQGINSDWSFPELEALPNYPECPDPEVVKFEMAYNKEKEDLFKPLVFDDYRVDKTQDDITDYQFMDEVEPPTKWSIQKGIELLTDPWEDTDPRNAFVYEEPVGPFISLVTTQEWGAKGVTKRQPLKVPVTNVRFSYTGTGSANYPVCFDIIKNLQKKSIEEGLPDIPYNFLIGNDGQLYEGRGFYVDVEKPPELSNLKGNCLDVAYIGDFKDTNPPMEMVNKGLELISYCIQKKIVDPVYNVIPFKKVA